MSRTDRQLARLLRADEPPEPPPELLETLRRDIPQLPPAPRYRNGKVEELHPRPFLGWMAAAASVVLALGASMLALRVAHESPPGDGAALTAPGALADRPAAEAAEAVPQAAGNAAESAAAGDGAPVAGTAAESRGAAERSRAAVPAAPPAPRAAEPEGDLAAAAAGAAGDARADLGAAGEAITVTTEAPLADHRRVASSVSVTVDELQEVPADREARAGRRETALRLESADEDRGVEVQARAEADPAAEPAPPAEKAAAPRATAGQASPPAPTAPARGAGARGGVLYRGAGPFVDTEDDRRSTFSLDVGAGSLQSVRRHLEAGRLPPADAVRVEEIVNAFAAPAPAPSTPDLAVQVGGAPSPWAAGDRRHLLRVAVRARGARPGDPPTGVVADAARAQVELDPRWVSRWRLVGHEAGQLPDERFRREADRGGALAVGHAVTAVYEIELQPRVPASARLALVRLRWRPAGASAESEAERVVRPADLAPTWGAATRELRLAAVAARFAEVLAGAEWTEGSDLVELARRAEELAAASPDDRRAGELARLAARARDLQRRPAP